MIIPKHRVKSYMTFTESVTYTGAMLGITYITQFSFHFQRFCLYLMVPFLLAGKLSSEGSKMEQRK